MLPIGDNNPVRRTPIITETLIVLNTLVYFLTLFYPEKGASLLLSALNSPRPFDLIFAGFFHADGWHFLGNMLFLYLFGSSVEDELGRPGYLVFYLVGGLSLGATSGNAIGASGAIYAILGAYLVLLPQSKVTHWLSPFPFTFQLPAFVTIGLWVFSDIVGMADRNSGIAHEAHLAGGLFGLTVAGLLISFGFIESPLKSPTSRELNLGPCAPFTPAVVDASHCQGATCPACLAAMHVTKIGDVELDLCFDCGGIWLDAGEAEQVLQRDLLPYSLQAPPARDASRLQCSHGERCCPHCEAQMRSVDMAGGLVEGCDHCNGIWLEQGELGRLHSCVVPTRTESDWQDAA
jgi:membrane associated rhomboid family serine protease/Zn-finger nucleic acid-binding protein